MLVRDGCQCKDPNGGGERKNRRSESGEQTGVVHSGQTGDEGGEKVGSL